MQKVFRIRSLNDMQYQKICRVDRYSCRSISSRQSNFFRQSYRLDFFHKVLVDSLHLARGLLVPDLHQFSLFFEKPIAQLRLEFLVKTIVSKPKFISTQNQNFNYFRQKISHQIATSRRSIHNFSSSKT